MKKVSIALSALAVAATVSTAMAHTKSTLSNYCLVRATINGVLTLQTFNNANQAASVGCSNIITQSITIEAAPTPFKYYGYLKTTGAGVACQTPPATCPALRAAQEN